MLMLISTIRALMLTALAAGAVCALAADRDTLFYEDFADKARWSNLTVVNANNDNYRFEYMEIKNTTPCGRLLYAKNIALDDWLFTAPVHLEAGKIYRFESSLRPNVRGFEDLELRAGLAPTPEAANIEVLDTFRIEAFGKRTSFVRYGYFQVPVTGDYYMGVHAVTPARDTQAAYVVFVENMLVAEGMAPGAPQRPAPLSAVPAKDASRKATITSAAPTLDMTGQPLSALTAMTLTRNGQVVKTWQNPAPGSALTFVDTAPGDSIYTYALTAANAAGTSDTVSRTTFVGVDKPGNVTDVTLRERDGGTRLSWKAPALGVSGYPISSQVIAYNIYRDGELYLQQHPDTVLLDTLAATGLQRFVAYSVEAVTAAGKSAKKIASETIPVGVPLAAPWCESAYKGAFEQLWFVNGKGWEVKADAAGAQDRDGGYFSYHSTSLSGTCSLESAKIQLPAEGESVLTLRYKGTTSSTNGLYIAVREQNHDWTHLVTLATAADAAPDWKKLTVPLAQFAGKQVQVRVRATSIRKGDMLVDNIRVAPVCRDDIRAVLLAPDTVVAGRPVAFTANVENVGSATANGPALYLRLDGKQRLHLDPDVALAPDSMFSVGLTDTLSVFAAGTVDYTFEAFSIADGTPDDNHSTRRLVVIEPTEPAPTALDGTRDGLPVRLRWAAPSASDATLLGYRLYRDSTAVAALPASPCEYTDTPDAEAHTYHLTALYSTGESEPSAPFSCAKAGVDGVDADEPTVVGTFTPEGLPAAPCARGHLIQRLSDGSVRKLLRK